MIIIIIINASKQKMKKVEIGWPFSPLFNANREISICLSVSINQQ